jgi:phosphatidylglycerophosphate synthase
MAERLPSWVLSDHLTLLALAAMGLAGAGFVMASTTRGALWIVVVALVLNWFGDSLDGTLARVRKTERPRYGFYVDHVLDIVGITLLLGGLAYSEFMSPMVALWLLVAYLLVAGEVFLATAVHGVFRMSFAALGPTELRILLAAGTLALFRDPQVDLGAWGRFALFDVGGVIGTVGLAFVLIVNAVRNARALALLEPVGGSKQQDPPSYRGRTALDCN